MLRAVAAVFVVFGAFWGTWAVAAADVQHALHLSPAGLGLLLSSSVGVGGLAAAASGAAAERWGTRVFLARALALWGLAAAVAGIAADRDVFVAFFVVSMVAAGLVDMAMNAGAAAGVGGDARRMMQFHALFNCGALCGAALAGVLIGSHHTWHWSWVTSGSIGFLLAVGIGRAQGWPKHARPAPAAPAAPPEHQTSPAVPRRGGPVHSLSVLRSLRLSPLALAFVATAGVEGGIDTWGVLYLRRQLAAGILLGAGAYGVGQVIAVTVRGAGAGPIGRVGPRWGLVAGSGAAAAGLLLESLSGHAVVAALGLVLAAAGIAVCWPLAMSAVSARAAVAGISPAPVVGALTASGYVGWVAGPAVVGLVANGAGLRAGFLVLAGLAGAACTGLATVPVATGAS
ncbi:MAG TPA: MFS transporter [Acidimicrobiales bacterium]|nr:MFS transporter [Acidimicrobiales bacterium]